MAIDRALDHADLVAGEALFIERGVRVPAQRIIATPRIGIDYAEEWAGKPLRFVIG
jgi:DNA-3-methyladenine glycosylase